jgi:hypothetical protein
MAGRSWHSTFGTLFCHCLEIYSRPALSSRVSRSWRLRMTCSGNVSGRTFSKLRVRMSFVANAASVCIQSLYLIAFSLSSLNEIKCPLSLGWCWWFPISNKQVFHHLLDWWCSSWAQSDILTQIAFPLLRRSGFLGTNVEELKLLGDQEISKIQIYKQFWSKFKFVSIYGGRLERNMRERLSKYIQQFLQGSVCIQTITFHWYDFKASTFSPISAGVKPNQSLQTISLDSSRFDLESRESLQSIF